VILGEAENWREGSIVRPAIFCQEYFSKIFARAVFFAAGLRKIFACPFGQFPQISLKPHNLL